MSQPAFPTCADNGHSMNQDGMSLRDYFAAKAMQALLTRIPMSGAEQARQAYIVADAMMKAREA